MATRLLYLGVLLFLAIAAAWTSGAAAFGLPRVSSEYCAWTSPFNTVNATAIHIGNTKSCISGYGGRLDPYTMYQFCIPSWVAFTANATLFGEAAMNHAAVSPGTAVSGFKRLLGVSMSNEIVKREAELVPYEFTTQLGRCGIKMETEEGGVMEILPESVAGILMGELKKTAEAWLGRQIMYAVVTVPADFNDAQKSHVTAAAELRGGFHAAKAVDEEVAAAAAYRLHEKRGDGKAILVFHLGGRTCHATKFRFQNGTARLLAERRDAYLGGDDFTGRIVDYFVKLIKEKHHRDISEDEGALRKLRADSEVLKKSLSDPERESTPYNVGSLLDGENLVERLTRSKFEELNRDLVARAMEMVDQVVMGDAPASQSQSRKDDIDEIILVGGSVRIPMVEKLVEGYFHGRGLIRDEEAMIRGAALLSRPESGRYVDECYYGGSEDLIPGHSKYSYFTSSV